MSASMVLSANVTLLNFSFLENTVFCHSITYHLDSGSKWLTQFRYSKAPKILIEVHRETRKASDIYHLQRKAQELRATCHNMTTPKEEEIQDCAVSRKNHGYSLWDEKSVSCKLLALRDNMEFWLLCWNISLNSQFHWVCPTWWMSEVLLLYYNARLHTIVVIKNLDGQCCCI